MDVVIRNFFQSDGEGLTTFSINHACETCGTWIVFLRHTKP